MLIFLKKQSELRDVWAQEFCVCNFDIMKNTKQI